MVNNIVVVGRIVVSTVEVEVVGLIVVVVDFMVVVLIDVVGFMVNYSSRLWTKTLDAIEQEYMKDG